MTKNIQQLLELRVFFER